MADNEENGWEPCWLYRLVDNEVEAKLFADGPPENPKEWHDAPPKKRGRPAKEDKDEE